jgi:hypothetical protein
MATKYVRSPEVEETRVRDSSVLFHRGAGKAVVLNATGSFVWSLLTTTQYSDDLAEKLREKFPSVSLEQATLDVEAFLRETVEHGIVLQGE